MSRSSTSSGQAGSERVDERQDGGNLGDRQEREEREGDEAGH